MGQARKRQGKWGRKVIAPLTYAPISCIRYIPVSMTSDPEKRRFCELMLNVGAKSYAALPSPARPEGAVLGDDGVSVTSSGENASTTVEIARSGEDVVAVVPYDDKTLALLDADDLPDGEVTSVAGHGQRLGFVGDERFEIAVDVESGRLVFEDGTDVDPLWLERHCILTEALRAFPMGGSFTLRSGALVAAIEGGSLPAKHLAPIMNHLQAQAKMCEPLARNSLPLLADIEALRQVAKSATAFHERLAEGPRYDEAFAAAAVNIVQSVMEEIVYTPAVRIFCEATGVKPTEFVPVEYRSEEARRILSHIAGDPSSSNLQDISFDDGAAVFIPTDTAAGRAFIDAKLTPFLNAGVMLGDDHDLQVYRHSSMIVVVGAVDSRTGVAVFDIENPSILQ